MAKIAKNDHIGGCSDLNKAVALWSKEAPDLVNQYCK
jgi:hypothetical protein